MDENTMMINIKKLDDKAITPTQGSRYAAGCDLHARIQGEGQIIETGKTEKIKTGIAMEIPNGYFGAIFARSGLATERGLYPANCVGVVDSDYRGEIIVALHNNSNVSQIITDGDRIAQLVIVPYLPIEFNEVNDLNSTERGAGGFGSTGINSTDSSEQWHQITIDEVIKNNTYQQNT